MPLDRTHDDPMYLIGRLAALAEQGDDRLPMATVDLALATPIKALPELERRIHALGHSSSAAEVYDLLDPGALPAGPTPMEMRGGYWLGYYHQRGYPRHVSATEAQLREAGEALFGPRWQTDLAELLGWRDAARLRQILRGERPIAGGAIADLVAEMRTRALKLEDVADRLGMMLAGDAGDAVSDKG